MVSKCFHIMVHTPTPPPPPSSPPRSFLQPAPVGPTGVRMFARAAWLWSLWLLAPRKSPCRMPVSRAEHALCGSRGPLPCVRSRAAWHRPPSVSARLHELPLALLRCSGLRAPAVLQRAQCPATDAGWRWLFLAPRRAARLLCLVDGHACFASRVLVPSLAGHCSCCARACWRDSGYVPFAAGSPPPPIPPTLSPPSCFGHNWLAHSHRWAVAAPHATSRTNQSELHGLNKELADKRAAKYSVVDEAAVKNWIADCTGAPFPDAPFAVALHNGVLLCQLLNAISPGKVKKINESSLPFKMMVGCPVRARGRAGAVCVCVWVRVCVCVRVRGCLGVCVGGGDGEGGARRCLKAAHRVPGTTPPP
jgi:hypothetical protein